MLKRKFRIYMQQVASWLNKKEKENITKNPQSKWNDKKYITEESFIEECGEWLEEAERIRWGEEMIDGRQTWEGTDMYSSVMS